MAVHLALITVGVLIALSFEGVASWREHRALVREARLNLTNELRDNIKELSNRLQKLPEENRTSNTPSTSRSCSPIARSSSSSKVRCPCGWDSRPRIFEAPAVRRPK